MRLLRLERALLIRVRRLAGEHGGDGLNRDSGCLVVTTAVCDFGLRQRHVRAPVWIASKLRH